MNHNQPDQRGKEHQADESLHGFPLSDTSIQHPVFVMMLMLLALVLGLLSFYTMPVNLLPEIDVATTTVQVDYPGAGPESVADQVARPIEDELATLSGVDALTSVSVEGRAIVIAEFEEGVDATIALQDVRERVTQLRPQLPEDINEPEFRRVDRSQDPVLTLAVTSSQRDSEELRRLLEDQIVPRIQQTSGVGSVTLTGGLVRQINVLLDLNQLHALHISPSQVSDAIRRANTNLGLGNTLIGSQEVNLRTPSVFENPDDILRVGVTGSTYTIGDVATIEDGFAEIETYSRLNGEETIIVDVRRQSGSNTVAVAEGALGQIERAFAEYPDMAFELISNEAEDVRANIDAAIEEMLVAVVFAILIVWLFFRDIRNTFGTVLGMPFILIGTFAVINALGISLNIMSLLALSVSVGLVIDDAIVVRENIFRRIERGEPPKIAASRGTAQVAFSVLAMTLTIIVVFLPAAFTSGITGIVFRSFSITVVAAMTLSLIEAFTLAPMLSAYWFKRGKHTPPPPPPGQEHLPDEAFDEVGFSGRLYERFVAWSLRHRSIIVIFGGLVLAASIYAARGIEVAFLPNQQIEQFGIAIETPPGTPLEETDRIAREVEALLLNDPNIESVLTKVGAGSIDSASGGAEDASFLVTLNEEDTIAAAQQRLRPQLAEYPGLAFSLPTYQSGSSTAITNRPIQIRVRSTADTEDLVPVVAEIIAAMDGVEGLADLASTHSPGKPEVQYALRQELANDYGLTNDDLARTMRALVDGTKAAVYRTDGDDFDIVVQLQPDDREDIAALQRVRLAVGPEIISINTIADVSVADSPATIRRYNRLTEVLIGGNNIERNVNLVEADMAARLATIDPPAGIDVGFAGASEDQGEGFQTLLITMGLSVLLVYMVLASQFDSLLQPIVIMLAMPLSFMGAFLALRLTNIELDILGMIGMLMLMGLVVKNSIMLVDFTNLLRRAGLETQHAISRASALRLRPILMTALTLILGNVPAAVGLGEGAELRRGLATVVIGGMTTSTLLTLVIVPVAYSLLLGGIDGLKRLFRRSPRPNLPTDTTISPPNPKTPSPVSTAPSTTVPALPLPDTLALVQTPSVTAEMHPKPSSTTQPVTPLSQPSHQTLTPTPLQEQLSEQPQNQNGHTNVSYEDLRRRLERLRAQRTNGFAHLPPPEHTRLNNTLSQTSTSSNHQPEQ